MSNYKEDILRLRSEGKTYGEISELLGCSKGTVAYYLKDSQAPTPIAAAPANSEWPAKVLTYIDNYKIKRPCIACSQYLHQSQLDAFDGTDVARIVASVVDKETFEESKRKISQLKFICANCDRLRQFRANN
jgi:predicted transcriptional regulator